MVSVNELSILIEELLDKGASDFEVSKAIKGEIKQHFSTLQTLFKESAGKGFLVSHTKAIDTFLIVLYKYLLRDNFKDYQPSMNSLPVTLVALGSYGREQLSVYSDIDLMIVYKDLKGYNLKPVLERYVMLLWDAGLKIGHRVHEVGELFDVAHTDITIKTAMLESRYLFGSRFLWTEIQNQLSFIRRHEQYQYIMDKLGEYRQRHRKYPMSMEPYIKEGVGALRDTNTLFWVATALFGVSATKDLSGRLFSDEAYKSYRIAIELLYKVRTALHLAAGKKQDRLTFQYQPEVAKMLGFSDTATQSAERQMIARILDAMGVIYRFTTIYLDRLARRPYIQGAPLVKSSLTRYEDFFTSEQCVMARRRDEILSLHDTLKAFMKLPDRIWIYHPTVLGFLEHVSPLAKMTQTTKTLLWKLFSRRHTYEMLLILQQADLLERFIPPLRKVIDLAQFDGYHTFPVDIHSLQCVKKLEMLEDPFLLTLWEGLEVKEKALLKLVVLLHDAGKGRKGDHSEIGAKLFRKFGESLGLDETLLEMGSTLIRHHIVMSHIAQREDIYNEKVILGFVTLLKEKKLVDMLYLLTYADIQGVGEGTYTSFTAELLRELYNRAVRVIDKKELLDEASVRRYREGLLQKNRDFQNLARSVQRKVLAISSNLFFIKYKSPMIIDLAQRVLQTQIVRVDMHNDERFVLEIFAKQEINLGWLLGRLSFLDITDMDIFKLFDGAKYFKISFEATLESDELLMVEDLVMASLDMSLKTSYARPTIKADEIIIDCDHSNDYASMSLVTPNQKGLMAYIIEVFDSFGIDIATAKISTIRKMARDLFLIEKNSGFCRKKEDVLSRLIK